MKHCSVIDDFPGRWLPFLAEVQSPPTPDLINKLCAVGLDDGTVMVRKLRAGRRPGLYHLQSATGHMVRNARVKWAAAVTGMAQI